MIVSLSYLHIRLYIVTDGSLWVPARIDDILKSQIFRMTNSGGTNSGMTNPGGTNSYRTYSGKTNSGMTNSGGT